MNENDLTAAIAVNNMLCDTTIACFTAAQFNQMLTRSNKAIKMKVSPDDPVIKTEYIIQISLR